MSLKLSIIGINVFLERRRTRMFVGCLNKEKGEFVFKYDPRYLRAKHVIPLGPELPLTKREFYSTTLFPSFEDRIPSRHNPAYVEYCEATGISPQENDPFILLSTIGKRGPSSFIFEPVYDRAFSLKDIIAFRTTLDFTTREFAQVFEIPQASLNALERKRSSGKDLLKRLEIIIRFPDVARYFLLVNGGALSFEKYQHAASVLKKLERIF